MLPPDSSPVGAGLALVAAFSLAATAIAVRLGTRDGRSTDALLVVFLVNVVVLVPLSIAVAYPTYPLSERALWSFAGAGLVGTLFARILYYASIERIGAARSEPIKASQPLHASLLAILLLGETLTSGHAVGILLVVVGVAVVTVEATHDQKGLGGLAPAALLLPLGAAILYGVEPIFVKVGLAEGTPAMLGLAVRTLAASLGFVGYLWYRGRLEFATSQRSSVGWYVLAGIANTVFLLSYYTALSVSPVTVVIPIMQTSPVFVVGLSLLFLQRLERVTPQLVVGAVVVVAGAVMVTLAG